VSSNPVQMPGARPRMRTFRAVAGCAMAVLGLATLALLVVMTYGGAAGSLDLGLASTVLISGAAQVALLIGAWLAWTALPRTKRRL
jgi:hypothetical protein